MAYIDILDQDGVVTGEQRTKDEAHNQGLWHRVVWVWVHDGSGNILLQKRANDPDRPYPGMWDIAAGGHLDAGDTVIDGARREAKEELGIDLDASQVAEVDSLKLDFVLNQGNHAWQIREFVTVFLALIDRSTEFSMQQEEVSEVRWWPVAELEGRLASSPDQIVPHDGHYQNMIEFIRSTKTPD